MTSDDATAKERLHQQDVLLIQRMVEQDRSALSTLYDRYGRVVYAVAYRSLGSVEESEEVVMDVFAKVWTTATSYDTQKSRVDTWIFMIARSRVLDRLRSKQRRGKVTEAVTSFATPAVTPDASEELEMSERRTQVLAALASLPAEQREVIELAYYRGWSQREIADHMGTALGTVKTRIRLGLEKLRSIPQLIDSF